MSKPIILQTGPYPDWDQEPLDAAFDSIGCSKQKTLPLFLRMSEAMSAPLPCAVN
jgi:hypothetical protein